MAGDLELKPLRLSPRFLVAGHKNRFHSPLIDCKTQKIMATSQKLKQPIGKNR